MTKPRKKTISKIVCGIDIYSSPEFQNKFYDTVEDVIEAARLTFDTNTVLLDGEIKAAVEKYKDKYSRFTFKLMSYEETVSDYSYDSYFEDRYLVQIWGHRPETDKEHAYRLKRETMAEAKMKKLVDSKNRKDLKEYERLKKKFG